MERLLLWIRENPQFAAITFFLVVLTGVTTFIAVLMSRAGLSLRPIVWFLGFVFIIAGPQGAVHFLDGLTVRKTRAKMASSGVPAARAETARGLAPVEWKTVFGPKADPALITDAKRGLAPILGDASEAKLSFNASGESALAARFPSPHAAAKALNVYGSFFAFANVTGSDAAGWTARRHQGQGEWVHVVAAGNELYAWTGADRSAVLENRIRALGPLGDDGAPVEATRPRAPDGSPLVSERLSKKVGLMLTFVGINLVVAALWFFKGSAWAARIDGASHVRPASAADVRREILGLNQKDVPTDVKTRPDGTIEINWRYADARWFDLMRVHQMKRLHRLVLSFDDAGHTVRVREFMSAFDGSAGPGGLKLQWKAGTGIDFFAYEHTRVVGVQLGADGKPTGELSKAYTFNLQQLKGPVIDVVTRAGWRWQPVTWNVPESLRWLAE